AGISTALHLAQIAPELVSRTLILEKARHPRSKLCGGGLLPDAEVVLHSLGLDGREVSHYDVDWAHFDYDGKGMRMRGEKRATFAFRIIRRHEFDAWLADKARQRGFLIHENTAVRHISVSGSEVVLETDQGEYRATVVVGADGSKSVIRRLVVPHESTHTARLLEIVTEPRPDKSFHLQADSYFDFLYVPNGILGYTWDFPAIENGQPVRVRGICDSNVYPVKKDISLQAALADEFRRHGYRLDEYKLEGHPLRWFEAKSPFSMPHVLLVGDSAGADALFGEGISIALGYGRLAAQAIQQAFARQDFSFQDYRNTVLRSELGKALQRRTWLAKIFYRLRSRTIQAFIWRKLGWLVEWVMQTFMIGWAK
ncbi:MAG: NAD(P)/FAD-dependent oxidoreductase, partial [Anaerolineales bacterium]